MMKTIGKIVLISILACTFYISSAQGSRKKVFTIDEVANDFCNYIETIPFYSTELINDEHDLVGNHVNALKNWKDKEAYIAEHQLNSYIKANRDTIEVYRKNIPSLVNKFLSRYGNKEIKEKEECIDSLQIIINNRLESRESNLNILEDELNKEDNSRSFWNDFNWKSISWNDLKKVDLRLFGIGAIMLIIFVVIIIWYKNANKKGSLSQKHKNVSVTPSEAASAIVVRRKTTSILRKQNLDDVIDNDAYLEINCADFASSSAVRKMFIKNTCIKDIYNMYAEDLRNPENPKEDGCMVLGRWVHDKDNDEYYVSLEHIVLPGDDAVFSEYELNFGGKIKLKVTEKLRKLRRETNLQYDLTCWVHSHPGLGVFFSNSDENVQMQLKHPSHPNFLTAIVVDIHTPQQEMGIFTFKKNGTLNAKPDLKKMYSLEELYKWAVESDRNTFKPEDHYNTLETSKSRYDNCYGIELSNSAIIDIGMLAAEQKTGFLGMIHGYPNKSGLHVEYVATAINKTEAIPDNELIGCFVTATHCSIPSIRKVIAPYLNKVKFALVYTASDDLLTTIPITNMDLCTDGNYYGEQKLEDLKIWTRRKR